MKSPRKEALDELAHGLFMKFGNSELISSIIKAEIEELSRNKRRIEVKDIDEIERKISSNLSSSNVRSSNERNSLGVFEKIRLRSTISSSPVKNAALFNIASIPKSTMIEPKKCYSPTIMNNSFIRDSILRPDRHERSKSVVRSSVENSQNLLPPLKSNFTYRRNGKKIMPRIGESSIFPAELSIESPVFSSIHASPSKLDLLTVSSSMNREMESKPGIPSRIDKITKNKYDQWGYIYKVDQIKYQQVNTS